MPNVPNWLSSQQSVPNGHFSGKRTILSAVLTVTLLAGCATVAGPSAYRPQIPARPELQAPPVRIECGFASGDKEPPEEKKTRISHESGGPAACVYLLASDLLGLIDWAMTLETELKASCLALGGANTECGTSAP